MSNTSAAQIIPPSGAGADPQPNLSVVPPPAPRRRAPMELNRAQAGELFKAQTLCVTAQKTAYAAKLAAHGINAVFVTALVTDIATARTRSIAAVQATDGRRSATNSQDVCARKLLRGLRVVQTAARQKYLHEDPAKLRDYYIGSRINESRAVFDQTSHAILTTAAADALPGIPPAYLATLGDIRTEWKACTAMQVAEQAAAKAQRAERNTMAGSVRQRRLELQFAADAAWPWNNPVNAGVRGEFKLPRHRPLTF